MFNIPSSNNFVVEAELCAGTHYLVKFIRWEHLWINNMSMQVRPMILLLLGLDAGEVSLKFKSSLTSIPLMKFILHKSYLFVFIHSIM